VTKAALKLIKAKTSQPAKATPKPAAPAKPVPVPKEKPIEKIVLKSGAKAPVAPTA